MRIESMNEQTDAEREEPLMQGKVMLMQWAGVLLAPAAYFMQLSFAYGLVNWVCRGGTRYVLTLITVLALGLCALGAYFAWRSWKQVGVEYPDQGGDAVARSRFMAFGGLILSVLFAVAILAQEIPNWIVGACVGR